MGNRDRFKLRVSANLLLMEDKKILLLRRFNTAWGNGKYTVISGHLDGNETIAEAMVREAKEEAGIELDVANLKVVHAMHRIADIECIDFFLTTTSWQGEPQNAEPDKADDIRWFPLDDLPENILPNIKAAIGYYQNQIPFSEEQI
jgi:8-oxo-dGTP diphosphatase